MVPGSNGTPSMAGSAGNGPLRSRMRASTLGAPDGRCNVTRTAYGRSAGRPAANRVSASTPPAEAPTATTLGVLLSTGTELATVRGIPTGPGRQPWLPRSIQITRGQRDQRVPDRRSRRFTVVAPRLLRRAVERRHAHTRDRIPALRRFLGDACRRAQLADREVDRA